MQELFVETDKKLIPTLPRYTFEGRIVVVQSEQEAERAVQYLSRHAELGIDTETRPSFRKGQQRMPWHICSKILRLRKSGSH